MLTGKRSKIAFIHDVIMAAVSFPLALGLRIGDGIYLLEPGFLATWTVVFAVIGATIFWTMRLYGGVWRYASLNDLLAITRAVTLAILTFTLALFLVTRLDSVPRSTPVINWFVLVGLLGGPRFVYRMFKDRRAERTAENRGPRRVPVLLVGAGDAAELFIRAVSGNPGATYQVVGLVDEKGGRIGRDIHGVHVLGGLGEIPAIMDRLGRDGRRPQRLILTKDNIDGPAVREIVDTADRLGVSLSRLPKLTDFRSSIAEGLDIRPIDIEDLLGRAQTVLDRPSMRAMIAGRRVLVTGAGGTIGGELSRQIAAYGPARLCLLDNSEYHLYEIDLEIGEQHPDLARHPVLADVRDAARLSRIMAAESPELVFHAAALKHVPVVEAHPEEGVLTNTIGTRIVADACRSAGVDAMVLISTDKAVNPSSMMGATKRLAESYCQALDILDDARSDRTRFVTVRFGNVLGSTGSVVPLFQRQLAAGGPLTVTHPDMKRYFMTVREAVELVLEASVLGLRGNDHNGKIYVLDMGEPVRIVDLARQIILLAGLRPDEDIAIEITGPRPGEKLHEELLHDSEPPVPTDYPGILLAAPRTADHALLARAIDELAVAAHAGSAGDVVGQVERLVPEYNPTGGDRSRSAVAR